MAKQCRPRLRPRKVTPSSPSKGVKTQKPTGGRNEHYEGRQENKNEHKRCMLQFNVSVAL
eukprot:7393357-Alexandrium_andersonii.AAC.1